jgi:hypothetical protein
MSGLHVVFYVSAALCLIAAAASFLRGKQTIYRSAPEVPVSAPADSTLADVEPEIGEPAG